MAWVESALGVPMEPGGRHTVMGTHNALLRLGGSTYLEVIAIDPDLPAPGRPRWFGLDDLAPDASPRLATWVARVDDLDVAAATSVESLGDIQPMERGPFAWRMTIPSDGRPPLDGLVPALIAWSTAQPALGLTDRGCRLVSLTARHPDPTRLRRALDAVGVGGIDVQGSKPGQPASIVASIETPNGRRRLGGRS